MNRDRRRDAGLAIGRHMREHRISRAELLAQLQERDITVSARTISNMTTGANAAGALLVKASLAVLGINEDGTYPYEPPDEPVTRDYPVAYGMADAIARIALIEAEDGRLTSERIAEFRALLDEAGRR